MKLKIKEFLKKVVGKAKEVFGKAKQLFVKDPISTIMALITAAVIVLLSAFNKCNDVQLFFILPLVVMVVNIFRLDKQAQRVKELEAVLAGPQYRKPKNTKK